MECGRAAQRYHLRRDALGSVLNHGVHELRASMPFQVMSSRTPIWRSTDPPTDSSYQNFQVKNSRHAPLQMRSASGTPNTIHLSRPQDGHATHDHWSRIGR
jgi:hypothetical protein